ncbi:MAG: hypothetical protein HY917_02875, partial [Candidatus Diapherotrites archaeon]|nr:hypothetical protein [Candidatus Diapherotrites archaeon]
LIPIGITGASNAFNMLAGFNGLEAGQGIIIIGALSIVALFEGKMLALLLGIAMLGSLLAFLYHNWFPAKVFGGDSLTLLIGCTIATMAILGNMEKAGIGFMGLFFIELAFKAKHKFQSQSFGIPQPDGTLACDPRGGSFTQWVMKHGRFTEPQVTLIILGSQAVIALTGLLFYFTGILSL